MKQKKTLLPLLLLVQCSNKIYVFNNSNIDMKQFYKLKFGPC